MTIILYVRYHPTVIIHHIHKVPLQLRGRFAVPDYTPLIQRIINFYKLDYFIYI